MRFTSKTAAFFGRRGGRVSTAAKRRAARRNGKKRQSSLRPSGSSKRESSHGVVSSRAVRETPAVTTMSAGKARLAESLERRLANIERLAARILGDRRVVEETGQRPLTRSPKADSLTRPLSSCRPLAKPAPGDPTDDAWEAWHERLEELDPRGGVYVRVSRIGEEPGPARGGGGDKLTFVTNLTDPRGPIEEEIQRAAQLKGIWGPAVAFRLQLVSRRTNRYLKCPDGRSAVVKLCLAIAPAPPGHLA